MVQTKNISLIIFFLVLLPRQIFPLSLREWTLAEKMQKAEAVGWGHLVHAGDSCVMKVTEVFKGNLSDKETVQYGSCGSIGDEVVCFKYPKRPKSNFQFQMEKIEKGSDKYIILQMLKDPVNIIKHKYLLSSPDVLEFIGFQFQSLRISSDKIPKISTHFSRPYNLFPWELKKEIAVLCYPSKTKEFKIKVHSISPETEFSNKIKRTLEWHYYRHVWPDEALSGKFEIKIHSNDIKKVGTMTREEAIGIISSALKSDSINIVITALHALGKMREPSLIPSVLTLLEVNEVKKFKIGHYCPFTKAIDYLEYSMDPMIVTSLLKKIVTLNLQSETERFMVSQFCSALKRFQDPGIKPALDYAAEHNINGAYEALSKHGDKKSVDIIIKSLSNPSDSYFEAVHSLHELVLRSNKKVLDWMNEPNIKKADESISTWIKWWRRNRSDFKLIKTFQQVVDDRYK